MIQSAMFWLVLASSVVVFWTLPRRLRPGFLAAVSTGYLATLEPLSALVLLGWSLVFYWLAPLAAGKGPKGQRLTAALVLAILGYLAYFKYIPRLVAALSPDPVERQILIPLGISYFTFKFIHYAIEVARGSIKERSLPRFASYVFLFPIFSSGPIERFDHFLASQETKWRLQMAVEGLTRIVHGLIKKFYIAEILLVPLLRGANAENILLRLTVLPTYKVWAFLVLRYLYIYMDFSAYSDIAIGASRLFGIRIMENFNFPVFAASIGDFWKRWHATLADWCRAYIYMPVLVRTRNTYVAVYSTFVLMGLWHSGSLNWICWGLYHATGVATYLTWARIKRRRKWRHLDRIPVLRHVGIPITFLFVTGGYALIETDGQGGVYAALRMFAKLFFINLPA